MSRKYSDEEVRVILRRALETAAPGDTPADGSGLSLDQIREIALEVGIDAARIDAAAASLVEPDAAPKNVYAGIPTTVQFQTLVPGATLDDRTVHEVLAVVRNVLGRQGIVGNEFGSLEWKARDAGGGRYVSLTPSPEGVRVRVMGNFRDGLGAALAGVGMVGATVAGILFDGAGLGPVIPFVGVAAAALIPPRFAYRFWRNREDTRMKALFDRIVSLLGERAGEPPGESDATGAGGGVPAQPARLPSSVDALDGGS